MKNTPGAVFPVVDLPSLPDMQTMQFAEAA
jgi:hypothetical protein